MLEKEGTSAAYGTKLAHVGQILTESARKCDLPALGVHVSFCPIQKLPLSMSLRLLSRQLVRDRICSNRGPRHFTFLRRYVPLL